MRMRCNDCDVYFELDAKPSVNFATAIGAVTGMVLTRRARGAALGGMVGWGLSKLMHKNAKCPRCHDIDMPSKTSDVDSGET